MPCDLAVIGWLPDVFDINADAGAGGDRDERKTGRVREIERELAAELRAESRLSECVVNETDAARPGLEILRQNLPEGAVRCNETLPIGLEAKTRAPPAFISRER